MGGTPLQTICVGGPERVGGGSEGGGHRAVGELEVDVRDAGGGEGGGVVCIRIVEPHLRAARMCVSCVCLYVCVCVCVRARARVPRARVKQRQGRFAALPQHAAVRRGERTGALPDTSFPSRRSAALLQHVPVRREPVESAPASVSRGRAPLAPASVSRGRAPLAPVSTAQLCLRPPCQRRVRGVPAEA